MKRAVNFAVSACIFSLVIWWADAGAVMAHLYGASVGWLVLAGLSLTVLTFVMAKRWQIVARAVDIDIDYRRAVAEYYIAQLVNLLLPGGVVGDVARAVRVRDTGDMVRAVHSVAAERIVGQVVTFGTLGLGLGLAIVLPGGIAWPAITWLGLGTALVAVAAFAIISRSTGATGRFFRSIGRLLTDFRVLGLSLLITLLLIFSVYACARATGTTVPPSGWFTLIPLILSAMLIPLSVGGWGWREGAAAALFPLIGATPDAGIAYGGMMMIAALPGIYFGMRAQAASRPSTNQMETL